MPTPRPEPIKEPKNDLERMARIGAVGFIREFFRVVDGYAYGTRSHMPGGMDFTNFSNSVNSLLTFCRERPDWTLDMLCKALAQFDVNYSAAYELQELQDVIKDFEEVAGVKLDRRATYMNRDIARAIAVSTDIQEAEKKLKQLHQEAMGAVNALARMREEVTSLVASSSLNTKGRA